MILTYGELKLIAQLLKYYESLCHLLRVPPGDYILLKARVDKFINIADKQDLL